jgi:hypothetical protein
VTRRALAALALVLAAPAASAATEFAAEGGLRYACGGVGAEERRALKALEAQASLRLLFVTAKRGGYLADAEVAVADAGGATRLRLRADGPICLLALPEGKYRITATLGGVTRTAAAEVRGAPGRARAIAFEFPGEPWDGVWASAEEKQQARE